MPALSSTTLLNPQNNLQARIVDAILQMRKLRLRRSAAPWPDKELAEPRFEPVCLTVKLVAIGSLHLWQELVTLEV